MQDNITFVLVRPQFLGNLGSAARALKNFGFSKMRLVAPPKNYKDAEARKMSVGAFDVLKAAEVFASLEEALADVVFAVGTTSGKQRERPPMPIADVAPMFRERAPNNKCAIVFGDEVNGLSRTELQRCHHTATIPTNPDFSALNVAQAIGIVAYELSKLTERSGAHAETVFATGATDDAIFAQIDKLLDASGFTKTFNREKVVAELRAFYQRAHPTAREADLLVGALIKLNEKVTG
jgi:tRNA (cytidine32/uridine32-2'-O)-methyltransferase